MLFAFIVLSQLNLGGYQGGISIGGSNSIDSLYMHVVKAWPFSYTSSVATDGKKGYAATKEGVYVVSPKSTEPTLLPTQHPVKAVRVHNGVVYAMLKTREGIATFKSAESQGVYASDANCLDMAFSGKTGFIAAGEEGLLVVSLADPLYPEDIAFFDLEGYCQAVDVESKYAAVAAGGAGVYLLDISNARHPKLVASFNTQGTASDVDMVGKWVFVADGKNGLLVLDFSRKDPLVSTYKTPGFCKSVKVLGKYAYVATGKSGIRILDVSNVSDMVERAYYNTAGFTGDVAVAPPLVFIADGQYGLVIMENSLLKYFK